MKLKNNGIFIIGTGTDIGKTYISGLVLKDLINNGIKANYYKAVASGNPIVNDKLTIVDAECVKKISGTSQDVRSMVSYVYKDAISPHLAGRKENNFVKLDVIKHDYEEIQKISDFVVVEGSGGILCSIVYENNSKIWLEDIVKLLDIPVLIVADAGLGTINATGLTVHYLKRKSHKIKGIILNKYDSQNTMHVDNKLMIEELTQIPVVACVGDQCRDIEYFDGFSLTK